MLNGIVLRLDHRSSPLLSGLYKLPRIRLGYHHQNKLQGQLGMLLQIMQKAGLQKVEVYKQVGWLENNKFVN